MLIDQRTVKTIISTLVFISVFLLLAALRTREFATDSVDWLVALKLGVYTVSFSFSMLFVRQWGAKMTLQGNLAMLVLLILMFFSSIYSPRAFYTAGAAFSIIALVTLFCMAVSLLGEEKVLDTVLKALHLVTGLSLIAYVAYPQMGRMHEWVNGVYMIGNRLTGITGTANAIGYAAALALLLLYLKRQYFQTGGWSFWAICAMQSAALLLSQSRTAFAAMLAALAITHLCRMTYLRLALFFTAAAAVMVVMAFVNFDALFVLLSRSGDASEITTGTGRTQVWQISWDYIMQRPWLGWGYGSPPFIMVNFTDELGHKVTHAHNAFLQIAFSLGFIGLAAFSWFFVTALATSIRQNDRLRLSLLLFLLFTSLTESSTFVGVANSATLVLAIIVSVAYRPQRHATPSQVSPEYAS